MQLMLQAAIGDCLALDPFAFEEDGLSAPEVDVSRGKIVEALVKAGMVVVLDEGADLAFEIAGQVVVLKQDAVLERLMPALDLALGHRMIRRATDVPAGYSGHRAIWPGLPRRSWSRCRREALAGE